jgi:hypothetical protein
VAKKEIMAQTEARRSKDEMYPVIEAWQDSGLTGQAFCDHNGIAKSVFYYWHKRYKADKQPGGFVPIDINRAHNKPSDTFIEIQYPTGVILRLAGQTPLSTIRQYLQL